MSIIHRVVQEPLNKKMNDLDNINRSYSNAKVESHARAARKDNYTVGGIEIY